MHGLRIRLQAQPFEVLAILLEHPGNLVTRDELQKKLWPADTFVDFDHGLNKAINKIRDVLGDSAESPRFVETVARRGYRFLAEVKVADAARIAVAEDASPLQAPVEALAHPERSHTSTAPHPFLSSFAWQISAFALLLAIISIAAWKLHSSNRKPPAIRSLSFRSKASPTMYRSITSPMA